MNHLNKASERTNQNADKLNLVNTPPDNNQFDVMRLLSDFWQYKYLIVGVVVATTLLTFFWTTKQPRIYQAHCDLQYDPNPPRPLGTSVEDVGDPMGNFWASREFFATENRVIESRMIAERVVEQLGLHEDLDFLLIPEDQRKTFKPVSIQDAAKILVSRVSVDPELETRIVTVSVRDQSPERAQTIANKVVSVYIDKTIEDRMKSTLAALEFLNDEQQRLQKELDGSELQLHDFKKKHNVLSVSMEDRQNLVAADIQSFNESLTKAHTHRIELAARSRRIREALEEDPVSVDVSVFNDDSLSALRQSVRERRSEVAALGVRYGENWPEMRKAKNELLVVEKQLKDEIAVRVRAAELDLREVRAIEGGLRNALSQSNDAGLELNLREIEYQRLHRERENNSKLYNLVLQRTTETNLTKMLRTTHVRIVDPALVPKFPVSPSIAKNTLLGLLAGLIFGFAIALALSRLDRRIKGVDDVEALGIAVIGILPSIDEDPLRDTIVETHPMSVAAECLRTVRTNLTFMAVDKPIRSMVVTSAHPREGKTTVTINLAITLAQSGKRVLLVDSDLRRPRIHNVFGLRPHEGLSTVLAGASTLTDAVNKTSTDDLFLLASGPVPPNPSELLHGKGFTRFLNEAREAYDVVVFDSPPLTAATDAAVIGPQVDGTVFVIKANQTTRDAVASVIRQLTNIGATILGSVVNDVNLKSRRYGHGYYHYYRREGSYYTQEHAVENESEAEAAE